MAIVTVLAVTLAAVVWVYLFALPAEGLWARTWVAGSTLVVVAGAVLALTGRLGEAAGPATAAEVGWGLLAGVASVAATHAGHRLLSRWAPGFVGQVSELYGLRGGGGLALLAPIAVMGLGEELLFRGVVQDRAGLVVAVAAYAGVQAATGKWAMVLAGAALGTFWGGLFWWREGLVAPVVSHVAWTATLTLAWPLPAGRPAPTPTPDPTRRNP